MSCTCESELQGGVLSCTCYLSSRCRSSSSIEAASSTAQAGSSSSSLAGTPAHGLDQRREMSLRYARNLEPSKNQYARRWVHIHSTIVSCQLESLQQRTDLTTCVDLVSSSDPYGAQIITYQAVHSRMQCSSSSSSSMYSPSRQSTTCLEVITSSSSAGCHPQRLPPGLYRS